jgi:MarR family transcriptional regulator, lower aerobic nicotinate degradation pathway regulator
MIERTLRPYGLGSTQWYVLYHLANDGPTAQRNFQKLLQVEKPTLSDIVAALVRKGFIDQVIDPQDKRQRVFSLTSAGRNLWADLPDPISRSAFKGIDDKDLKTVVRVLQTATEHLNAYIDEGDQK